MDLHTTVHSWAPRQAAVWQTWLLHEAPSARVSRLDLISRIDKLKAWIEQEHLSSNLDAIVSLNEIRNYLDGGDRRVGSSQYVKVCEHGKALNDYCEPCGRINNG
jgi:hypothetical protein